MKASTDGKRKKFAIAIAQSQRAKVRLVIE